MSAQASVCEAPLRPLTVLLVMMVSCVFAGRSVFLGRDRPRTLQMIGSANPRMLHRISADLHPDTSKVVHIQVPYYIERPKVRTKKFQPWIPRGQRFVSPAGHSAHIQQQLPGPVSFGTPFKGKPILPHEFLTNPGPYDTPFVPMMKPSPINPLHVDQPAPEIMFEPISILPLEAPSFDTVRNHVNYLKQKQQKFFEGQGREFGLGDDGELGYYGGPGIPVHNGDTGREHGERNTLSEDDFGQNDRKYDRRGTAVTGPVEQSDGRSGEEDFYDTEGKQYQDDDFEDSREETDRAAAFEPKKVYTQVRHHEVVRHVPRSEDEEEAEDDPRDGDGKEQNGDDDDEDEDEEDDDEPEVKGPIRERVRLHRKNIVYTEKGHDAHKFDHGAEESFGEFEQQENAKPKRNRIKRSPEDLPANDGSNRTLTEPELVDVLAMVILGNSSEALPLAEALTDPRELHGEELLRFLDEAIQNTTQYLPEPEQRQVISIVSPPSNVVKFPYYNRPETEIDMDSALRYAENLTTFSTRLYDGKTAGIRCNEVDVELEDEPEPIPDGNDEPDGGFRPIRRLRGLGDKIDCLKVQHFGNDPLDNPLFQEEFVGVAPRKLYLGKGTTPTGPAQTAQQPNPAVAVYNDVIRHIKKHLANQQRRQNSKSDTEQDTVMIAVPRVLRLDDEDDDDLGEVSGAHLKREARLAFPQANPLPLSNHLSVPIFDISKFVPRFMMRPNEDLFIDDTPPIPLPTPLTTESPPKPRLLANPKVRLRTLVKTAEQLAEGAVAVEESVEQRLTTTTSTSTARTPPLRDDIADAFDDVLPKPNQPPAPLPPIKPYSVVEQDSKDTGPEPTFNKSGPPYAALALEPPVAQSILKQRIAPIERNQLDPQKGKRSQHQTKKRHHRKSRRPTVTRKKVLVFYH
ncbi:uncharacterized protein LOC128726862 [Anopheles nili]|uniref:uncharacterized protein LOC128726862 n=1 Tax=Anopheles nili TaxID=185578 RepID=UPI00237B5D12|nr:uncharacterized protein LOC128726862 [Anopheles nili]